MQFDLIRLSSHKVYCLDVSGPIITKVSMTNTMKWLLVIALYYDVITKTLKLSGVNCARFNLMQQSSIISKGTNLSLFLSVIANLGVKAYSDCMNKLPKIPHRLFL